MNHRRVLTVKLDDGKAELSRADHERAITALQAAPAVSAVIVRNVVLPNGAVVPVAHALAKAPQFTGVSVPRGAVSAGYITDIRTTGAAFDRSRFVYLQANGYGATVTVDVEVK